MTRLAKVGLTTRLAGRVRLGLMTRLAEGVRLMIRLLGGCKT